MPVLRFLGTELANLFGDFLGSFLLSRQEPPNHGRTSRGFIVGMMAAHMAFHDLSFGHKSGETWLLQLLLRPRQTPVLLLHEFKLVLSKIDHMRVTSVNPQASWELGLFRQLPLLDLLRSTEGKKCGKRPVGLSSGDPQVSRSKTIKLALIAHRLERVVQLLIWRQMNILQARHKHAKLAAHASLLLLVLGQWIDSWEHLLLAVRLRRVCVEDVLSTKVYLFLLGCSTLSIVCVAGVNCDGAAHGLVVADDVGAGVCQDVVCGWVERRHGPGPPVLVGNERGLV